MTKFFRNYFTKKLDEVEAEFTELKHKRENYGCSGLEKPTKNLIELAYTYSIIFSIEKGKKNRLVYERAVKLLNDIKEFEQTKLKKKV